MARCQTEGVPVLDLLKSCPLVASVQADPGTPCAEPETLARMAQASLDQGVRVLRLQGVENIRHVRAKTGAPTIGLIKRRYEGSDVYITATAAEVRALLELGCEIIALDGTARPRPVETLAELIEMIHAGGALVMADCDTAESARFAAALGADLVGTTLAGYTADRSLTDGPDLELLREIRDTVAVPIIAEGRYSQRWHVEAALRVGATAVVVGGALNDPIKQTRALMPVPVPGDQQVGAVDIGGTWLRFGLFDADWQLTSIDRTPNPGDKRQCLAWIRERIEAHAVSRVGVGTGGIVDPHSGQVWTAKEYLMPDHIGIVFNEETLGVPTHAFGDGHATAWGHACLPRFAGRRVATLALGTGVGAGYVQDGRIWAGRKGEYPRINDLPTAGGATYEDLLGGLHLTREPDEAQKARAVAALEGALEAVRHLYFPDDVVVAGSVGLSPWLAPHLERLGATPSPFGPDAGLHGAAALALFPTWK